jgi:hypothetical protein
MSIVKSIIVLSVFLTGCQTIGSSVGGVVTGANPLTQPGVVATQTSSPSDQRWGFSKTFPYEFVPYPGAPSQYCPSLNDIIDLSWINFGKQKVYDVVPY